MADAKRVDPIRHPTGSPCFFHVFDVLLLLVGQQRLGKVDLFRHGGGTWNEHSGCVCGSWLSDNSCRSSELEYLKILLELPHNLPYELELYGTYHCL